jgi:hypothetical protein
MFLKIFLKHKNKTLNPWLSNSGYSYCLIQNIDQANLRTFFEKKKIYQYQKKNFKLNPSRF